MMIDVGRCFHLVLCASQNFYIVYIRMYVGDAGRHSDGGILSNCIWSGFGRWKLEYARRLATARFVKMYSCTSQSTLDNFSRHT